MMEWGGYHLGLGGGCQSVIHFRGERCVLSSHPWFPRVLPGGRRLPARDAPGTDMPVMVAFPQVDCFPPGSGSADGRSRRCGQGALGATEGPFHTPRGYIERRPCILLTHSDPEKCVPVLHRPQSPGSAPTAPTLRGKRRPTAGKRRSQYHSDAGDVCQLAGATYLGIALLDHIW